MKYLSKYREKLETRYKQRFSNHVCRARYHILSYISGMGKVFNERATCENSKLSESHKFYLRC